MIINTCVGCIDSMDDGLMKTLRCNKCKNYDCYREDEEMTELKKTIYNQAIDDVLSICHHAFTVNEVIDTLKQLKEQKNETK